MPDWLTILMGEWVERLRTLPEDSVQCCVTSPPYWGLRDYGVPGQLGLEKTPEEYVAKMVDGFQEVRRVLRDDGTLWVNLGDCYNSIGHKKSHSGFGTSTLNGGEQTHSPLRRENTAPELKHKDLVGIPWRVAFALQADGWWLRSDIIWSKPNPMPESVTDRPTRAHEYIFLLAKSARYYYDADSIADPPKPSSIARLGQDVEHQAGSSRANGGGKTNGMMKAVFGGRNKANGYGNRKHSGREDQGNYIANGVNKRSVWTVAPANFKEAHFATFPPALIKPCILAGSRPGDTVLDPFFGSGTTGTVAIELARKVIGIELNPDYIEMARTRCQVAPGLIEMAEAQSRKPTL